MAILTLEWYVLLGAIDDAHAIARRIVEQLERAGHLNTLNLPPVWLPELAPFRRDPRFDEFVAALKLIEYWKAMGPPDGYLLERDRLVSRPTP